MNRPLRVVADGDVCFNIVVADASFSTSARIYNFEVDYFADSQTHLMAELSRIDLLIQAQVERARAFLHVEPHLQGLYIPEDEIDSLVGAPAGLPRWAATPLPERIRDAMDAAGREIAQKVQVSVQSGITLRLATLRSLLELSDLDIDVLLIAIAPEMDLRYERLYAYLQDDVTRKRPSMDLALNLLCVSLEQKLTARRRFEAGAPLWRHGLVQTQDDSGNAASPALNRFLKVDEGIVQYLLDSDRLDERLAPIARFAGAGVRFDDLLLSAETVAGLQLMAAEPTAVLHFQGLGGSGRKSAAAALCSRREGFSRLDR
jgi:hypothetical protein